MADNFHDHITTNIRPPTSPDLNLLCYYMWSIADPGINEYGHSIKYSLNAAIARVMSEMNMNQVIQAYIGFTSNIEAVAETEGEFIG